MKITLTKSELLAILVHKFGSEITDVSVINLPGPKKVMLFCRKILDQMAMELKHKVDMTFVCQPHQKIPAIKALRTCVPGMGLGDAKWAIENWPKWIGYVSIQGWVPKLNNLYVGSDSEVTLT